MIKHVPAPKSVVAVHGLDGDYMESWSHKPTFSASTMWLRDLLPEKLPNCHVMTFQYDGRSIGPNAYGVREVATNLLQSLRDIRQEHVSVPWVLSLMNVKGVSEVLIEV